MKHEEEGSHDTVVLPHDGGSPDPEQLSRVAAELDHERVAQRGVRRAVAEHDPAVFRRSLPFSGARDVNDFVDAEPVRIARTKLGQRHPAGLERQDPSRRTRRILHRR